MGRIDDVINTAGHRLSTGQLEEIVSNHHDVAECAVIGLKDSIKGEVPVAFVVVKHGHDIAKSNLESELIAKVREELGAVASLKNCLRVPRLPKTRSGKVLRKLLRKLGQGNDYDLPATIEDASVIKEIEVAIKAYGLVK